MCVCVWRKEEGGTEFRFKGAWKADRSKESREDPENRSCAGMRGNLVIPLSFIYTSMIINFLCFPGNTTLWFNGILFDRVCYSIEVLEIICLVILLKNR